MSELKQKILEGIRISGLQDWAFTVNGCYDIVDYESLTDEDIDELATYISDEINEQPTLNENQQIVLDWSVGNDTLTKLIINISDVLKHPYKQPEHDDIMEQAFLTLTDEEIIQVFSVWKYEEQEEENSGE